MKKKFEEGKIYGKTSRIYSLSSDIAPSIWISRAYLVKKRTAKYITVEDVTPFSMYKGKVLKFYVYSLETEPYIPHEYIALNSYGKTHGSYQISSLDELDRKLLEEDYPAEHTAVYEPESYEEKYSDFSGDNSAPEQDIPLEREAEVNAEEPQEQERSSAKHENFYVYTCLHGIVAEQTNIVLEKSNEPAAELESIQRTGDKPMSSLRRTRQKNFRVNSEIPKEAIKMSSVIKETVKSIVLSAETPEIIMLALPKCTKAEMVEVYEELSGKKYPKKISGERKAEIVFNICKLLEQAREEAEFQSKAGQNESESREEGYSYLTVDASTPEQDIPLGRNTCSTKVPERENSYGSKCLNNIVAEQPNMVREKLSESVKNLECNLRTVDKSKFCFICSKAGELRKERPPRLNFAVHDKEYLIKLCLLHKFPERVRKLEGPKINCRKNYYPNIETDSKRRRPRT